VAQEGSSGGQIHGVEYQPFNFTVAVTDWQGDWVELLWESNGVYVEAVAGAGKELVFERDGPANQTLDLESSLIGVFTLKFYTVGPAGEKVYVVDQPELELVIRRENEQASNILSLVVFIAIGVALLFMGMELEMQAVIATLKVISPPFPSDGPSKHASCNAAPRGRWDRWWRPAASSS
jgi:hypothetical protein